MSEPALHPAPESLPFEAALKELEAIVNRLESGQSSLDEAIRSYERGSLLKKRCEHLLSEARMKLETITFSQNGSSESQPPSP